MTKTVQNDVKKKAAKTLICDPSPVPEPPRALDTWGISHKSHRYQQRKTTKKLSGVDDGTMVLVREGGIPQLESWPDCSLIFVINKEKNTFYFGLICIFGSFFSHIISSFQVFCL